MTLLELHDVLCKVILDITDEKKLAPTKVNNQQASYNLIIEWELSISNVEVTNTQTASGGNK